MPTEDGLKDAEIGEDDGEEIKKEISTEPKKPTTDISKDATDEQYKGLQRKYQKQIDLLQELQTKYDELVEESEGTKQEKTRLMKDLEKLQQTIDEGKSELDTLTGKLAVQKALNDRHSLIMSEYADLSQFEAKGLLPQAETEEEMRTKFEAFREALNTSITSEVEKQIKGAGSAETSGKGKTGRSKEELYAILQQTAGAPAGSENRRIWMDAKKEWDMAHTESET